MIITKKGNFIPKVFLGSAGHVIYVVLTLLPSISRTRLWISLSVILLICPFLTFLSQICSGLLPILYRMDKNPLWKVFLNIFCLKFSCCDNFLYQHKTICLLFSSQVCNVYFEYNFNRFNIVFYVQDVKLKRTNLFLTTTELETYYKR